MNAIHSFPQSKPTVLELLKCLLTSLDAAVGVDSVVDQQHQTTE